MSRLLDNYRQNIVPKLQEQFNYDNKLQVPRLTKVVVNVGVGQIHTNQKMVEDIANNIAQITGQRPVISKARKSIAGFKIREGDKIGVTVTLRGSKMYDFVERLISVVLPRIRDFRGLPLTGFDGHGNYSIGMREHTVFPEISYDTAENVHGLQINIATTAKTDEEAKTLLTNFGFPFQKEK